LLLLQNLLAAIWSRIIFLDDIFESKISVSFFYLVLGLPLSKIYRVFIRIKTIIELSQDSVFLKKSFSFLVLFRANQKKLLKKHHEDHWIFNVFTSSTLAIGTLLVVNLIEG
jgi:hypothetical protein